MGSGQVVASMGAGVQSAGHSNCGEAVSAGLGGHGVGLSESIVCERGIASSRHKGSSGQNMTRLGNAGQQALASEDKLSRELVLSVIAAVDSASISAKHSPAFSSGRRK